MRTVVLGCGNLLIPRDSVGIHVVRELLSRELPDWVTVTEAGTPGLAILDMMEGYDRAIIVDAVQAGGRAGEVYRFTGSDIPPVKEAPLSMHGFSLAEALQLGRRLGVPMPREIIIIGVEIGVDPPPEDMLPGPGGLDGVPEDMRQGVTLAVELVLEELERGDRGGSRSAGG